MASAAFLVALVIRRSKSGVTVATLAVLGIVGGVLGGWAPGAGSAFAFVAVFAAGRRLPARTAAVVALVTVAALTLTGLAGSRLSGLGVVGMSVGLVAAALGGLNRAAQQRVREQAELLLAEGQVVIEERARSAALAERTRIAREIHDVLAHSLSGLMLQLEAAHLLLDQHADPARIAGHVDRARGLASGCGSRRDRPAGATAAGGGRRRPDRGPRRAGGAA
ncbi:MAG: histidine kinase, partial [Pseudonocardiaceae bacterium]